MKLNKVLDKLPEEVTIIGAVFGLDGQQVYDSLDGSLDDTDYAYVSEVNGWIADEVLESFRKAGIVPPSGYYVRQLTNKLITNLKAKAIKRYALSSGGCL